MCCRSVVIAQYINPASSAVLMCATRRKFHEQGLPNEAAEGLGGKVLLSRLYKVVDEFGKPDVDALQFHGDMACLALSEFGALTVPLVRRSAFLREVKEAM